MRIPPNSVGSGGQLEGRRVVTREQRPHARGSVAPRRATMRAPIVALGTVQHEARAGHRLARAVAHGDLHVTRGPHREDDLDAATQRHERLRSLRGCERRVRRAHDEGPRRAGRRASRGRRPRSVPFAQGLALVGHDRPRRCAAVGGVRPASRCGACDGHPAPGTVGSAFSFRRATATSAPATGAPWASTTSASIAAPTSATSCTCSTTPPGGTCTVIASIGRWPGPSAVNVTNPAAHRRSRRHRSRRCAWRRPTASRGLRRDGPPGPRVPRCVHGPRCRPAAHPAGRRRTPRTAPTRGKLHHDIRPVRPWTLGTDSVAWSRQLTRSVAESPSMPASTKLPLGGGLDRLARVEALHLDARADRRAAHRRDLGTAKWPAEIVVDHAGDRRAAPSGRSATRTRAGRASGRRCAAPERSRLRTRSGERCRARDRGPRSDPRRRPRTPRRTGRRSTTPSPRRSRASGSGRPVSSKT
jgi:hypothetical protein